MVRAGEIESDTFLYIFDSEFSISLNLFRVSIRFVFVLIKKQNIDHEKLPHILAVT